MDISFLSKLGKPAEIVAALKRVSRGDELTLRAFYRWNDRKTISKGWRTFVARLAQEKGVKLPLEMQKYLPDQKEPTSKRDSKSSNGSTEVEAA